MESYIIHPEGNPTTDRRPSNPKEGKKKKKKKKRNKIPTETQNAVKAKKARCRTKGHHQIIPSAHTIQSIPRYKKAFAPDT
jgi:hypothetical protein